MLPNKSGKRDSYNLVDKESKQLQGETQSSSPNKLPAITSIIFFVVIICMIFIFFLIESISSMPKLLAWSHVEISKLIIVEIEKKQEFANF